MADIEKDIDMSTDASTENPSQTAVRDLVKDAGEALEVLAGADVAAGAAQAVGAEPVAAEAAPLKKSKRAEKRSSKKKKGLEAIEWSEEAARLDFVEGSDAQEAGEATALSAFEELARRVADTVSRKQSQEGAEGLSSEEPTAAELIAAELAHTADALVDTEAELHAESLAAALPADLAADANIEEGEDLAAAAEAMVATASALSAEADAAALIAAELGAADGEMNDFDRAMELEFGSAQEAEASAPAEQMGFAALTNESEGAEDELEADSLEADAADNDAAAEPREFIEADQLVSIIESLLFSTDKPVSIATIKQIFKGSNIRTKDISRALEALASEYASSMRGVTLEEINGGYQLRTKSDNTEFLRRLAKGRPFRLSGPALEVLSIVAYKQPVSKHEVDEIRGVESGHLVRALMERGLINFAGKSETLPGKPMTYGTTRKFLETFGLRNLRELPTLSEIEEILPEGIGEEQEKETLSDLTDRMSSELTSTYSEGEDELLKITEQLKTVDTTTEFFEQEKIRERERKDRERAQDIRERIVLGDNVEEKDRKWLDRYEAKLVQAEQAALAGVPVAVAADEASVEEPQIGRDLSALSDEARAVEEAKALAGPDEDEVLAQQETTLDDESEIDELAVNMDWDEDSESEKDI